MVKTIQSSFPPSPNFERVIDSFDKLNNTVVSELKLMTLDSAPEM